jgi:hypothetical protein
MILRSFQCTNVPIEQCKPASKPLYLKFCIKFNQYYKVEGRKFLIKPGYHTSFWSGALAAVRHDAPPDPSVSHHNSTI